LVPDRHPRAPAGAGGAVMNVEHAELDISRNIEAPSPE
jgi:hypothetical protein